MNLTARQWKRVIVAFLVTLTLLAVFSTAKLMAASTLEDGEYTVEYEILKGDPKDDSTSLANGYWNQPATVIVKNGAITVRTVINKDAWVIEFATKQGSSFVDAKVVSRDTKNDSRVVEFGVSSLEQDLVSSMTVDIPSINYYHSYEARFRFYPDTLKLVKAAESEAKATPEPTAKPTSTPTPTANSGSTSSPTKEATATTKPTATVSSSNNSSSQGSASEPKQGSKDQATSGSSTTGSSTTGSTSSGSSTGGNATGSVAGAAAGGNAAGSNSGAAADATTDDTATDATAGEASSTAVSEATGADEPGETPEDKGVAEGNVEQAGQADGDEEGNNAAEPNSNSVESTEEVEITTASSAEVVEVEENESGSTTLVILIIAIAALFVIGSIVWIVRKGKVNKK